LKLEAEVDGLVWRAFFKHACLSSLWFEVGQLYLLCWLWF